MKISGTESGKVQFGSTRPLPHLSTKDIVRLSAVSWGHNQTLYDLGLLNETGGLGYAPYDTFDEEECEEEDEEEWQDYENDGTDSSYGGYKPIAATAVPINLEAMR